MNAAGNSGQHVKTDRHELQTDECHDEVRTCGERHHSNRSHDNQVIEFTEIHPDLRDIVTGKDDGDSGSHKKYDGSETGEAAGHDRIGKRRAAQRKRPDGEGDIRRDSDKRNPEFHCEGILFEGVDHDHDQCQNDRAHDGGRVHCVSQKLIHRICLNTRESIIAILEKIDKPDNDEYRQKDRN